jgi:peptidoglycan/LPS O-acetylase OafA/YrhL
VGVFNLRDNLSSLIAPPQRHHFATLDGLRALSILWVMAFHCVFFITYTNLDLAIALRSAPLLAWTKYGFRGVDIFFVISGFIISHILMREHKATGRLDLKNFYLRRAVRLFPAYYVSLALYGLIDPLTVKNVWANLLYVNNFLPIEQQFMGWAWSLAIEEQFYIVFPLALLLLMKLGDRARVPVLAAATLAAAGGFVLLLRASACPSPPAFQELAPGPFLCYFDTLYDKFYTRCGALLMGVTVAYLYNYTPVVAWLDARAAVRRVLCGVACLLLLPATGFIETSSGVFSSFFAINYFYLFALGIAYLLLFTLTGSGQQSLVTRLLSARIWFPLAQLSYSAYLVHPTVLIAAYLFVLKPMAVSPPVALVAGLGLAALCFGVAAVIYLLVERPAMNARARFMAVDVGYATRPATVRSVS